jgi:hypothetical protein
MKNKSGDGANNKGKKKKFIIRICKPQKNHKAEQNNP